MAGLPITVYAPGSETAGAYRQLAQEILTLTGAADAG
jgi:cellulose biosynthesis protein BcsQ